MSAAEDLAAIFRRDYDDVHRFIARRLRATDEAADLAQEAFLRLLGRQGAPLRSPRSFLFTTALNLLRDRARARLVRRAWEAAGEVEQVVCPAPSPHAVLEARQLVGVLETALAELTPCRRAALLLHRLDGLSQAAVAAQLGLSLSSVEKHIRLALRHCARRLAETEPLDPARAAQGREA